MMKPLFLIPALICCLTLELSSQTSCASTFAKTIGSQLTNEVGYSIATDTANNILFIGGSVNDSTLLIKMKTDGEIIWSRTFDILRQSAERVCGVIIDSDGMICVSGMTDASTGGFTFLLKYDPDQNTVIYAKQYTSTSSNFGQFLIEKGPGGNYLICNNVSAPNDAELIEVDRNTGLINPAFSKHYHLGSSETLHEMVLHNGGLYSTGRFSDGATTANMRNTLIKLDPSDGSASWIRLGHRPGNVTARLYGVDLAIDQDRIYSVSHGDPDGTDLGNEELFIQKTTLTGQTEWVKRYRLPTPDDVSDELIATGDGFVVMGRSRGPSDIFLFKINHDGDVMWARTYDFSPNDNTYFGGGVSTQLVSMGDALYFTAFAEESGRRDMILVKTDSEGRLDEGCTEVKSINVDVNQIENAVFYSVDPTIFTFIPEVKAVEVAPGATSLQIENTCGGAGGPVTSIEASVCIGESYEGYDEAGIYADTFSLMNGCDSIRILSLRLVACDPLVVYDLDDCTSYMSDGSNMDYTEFTPFFPAISTCASVTASILHRSPPQENKHSCTPGLNNSLAMCVSALSGCNYIPGHEASVVIEVTITPDASSVFEITNIQFQEKAPLTYVWIDGGSGPNNYPTLFGLRILKNGTEIYSEPAIPTTLAWSLHDFSFTDDSLFEVDAPTVFRFELLPYCPVGNGAAVAAWDLEDIVISGGCVIQPGKIPVVEGKVLTIKGKPVTGTEIQLSLSADFNPYNVEDAGIDGGYTFNNLIGGSTYYIEGYNNSGVLAGVSTLDLIAIQRHILSKKPFTSLAQYVAADANHDDAVNLLDIVAFRKTLLGVYGSFPGNTSWRFGVWPQSLASDDLSTFQETKYIEVLQGGTTQADFLGIKVGDMNGELASFFGSQPIEIRGGEKLDLSIEDVAMVPGKPVTIDIRAEEDMIIEGLQLGWIFNDISLVDVHGIMLPIAEENISFTQDGAFRLSWHTDQLTHINKGDVLFSLTMIPTSATSLAGNILQAEEILASEIYSESQTHQANLEIIQTVNEAPLIISFFGVMPNPFNNQTTIRYKLEQDSRVRISIYDASGSLLHAAEQVPASGEHFVKLTAGDIGHYAGMMICQIVCDGEVIVRKVVRVE